MSFPLTVFSDTVTSAVTSSQPSLQFIVLSGPAMISLREGETARLLVLRSDADQSVSVGVRTVKLTADLQDFAMVSLIRRPAAKRMTRLSHIPISLTNRWMMCSSLELVYSTDQ